MPPSRFRACLVAATTAVALPATASAPLPLLPGEWTFVDVPEAASLDGRPLHDLPVAAASSEKTCLTPAQAIDPAAWLARDISGDCALIRRVVAGGRVDITGTCPPRDDGQPAGSLVLKGSYAADRYDLKFTTVAHGENGTMSFSGSAKGHRTGACP